MFCIDVIKYLEKIRLPDWRLTALAGSTDSGLPAPWTDPEQSCVYVPTFRDTLEYYQTSWRGPWGVLKIPKRVLGPEKDDEIEF